MIGRLANKEWYTGRMSACTLIPVAFPRMMGQRELRNVHLEYFGKLCKDDVPMVRRVASKNLRMLLYTVVETTTTSANVPDWLHSVTNLLKVVV